MGLAARKRAYRSKNQNQILAEVEYMFDLPEKYEYEQNVKGISVKSKLKKIVVFRILN